MVFSKQRLSSSPRLQPPQICVLAGAGISVPPPSSFPPAGIFLRHLLTELARGYASTDAYLTVLSVPPVKPSMQWEYLRFEVIMDRFALYDPQESFLRSTYSRSDARPNPYHEWLARMLLLGSNVITTNFDLMIESSLEALATPPGALPRVLTTDEECEGYLENASMDKRGGAGILQKLHGSITSAMAARFPQLVGSKGIGPRYEVAQTLMYGRTLLVVGYSGGDDFDVMPMLGYMYEYNKQSIIWIEHAPAKTPRSVSSAVPPKPILKPRYPDRGARGQFERIRGESATVVNLVCDDSCPRLRVPAKPSSHVSLSSVDLTDWERLSLLHMLMDGNFYANQTGLRSSIGQLLPKVAGANEQCKIAALIHDAVHGLFIVKQSYEPTADEITSAIKNATPPLKARLMEKIMLLEASLAHRQGAVAERDVKLRSLMEQCTRNAHWEIMCSAPDWAFRYCEELLEHDRRKLYQKVGWHLMVWSRDLDNVIGMLYVVDDADSLLNDGVSLDYGYWDYQESLRSALFYNERLGNVPEARNAAAHLQRVEWVWNQLDKHKEYGAIVEQLEKIISRRVPQLSF